MMQYPNIKHLYKYCSYNDNSLFILRNKKIWFSNSEEFSDPFDCKYKFKDEIDRAEFEEYGNKHFPEKMIKLNSQIRNNENDDVYNQIYTKFLNEVTRKLKEAGVFCLSQYNDNILMWSHYSDGHKGFCIEFERCEDNELGNCDRTYPIKYIDYDYERITVLNEKAYDMKFYTKAYDWKYEGEWRLIKDKYNETEPLPGRITSIIFGLRMDAHQKETIKDILSDLTYVKYSLVEEIPNQYKIKIIDA